MFEDSSEGEDEEILAVYDIEQLDDDVQRIRRLRRPRHAQRFFFDINVSQREFREKHRMSPEVLDNIVEWIGPELARRNNRGLPLSPRQRIQVFLHFLGTNSFYHDVGSNHIISRATVGKIVREVCNVLFEHRNEVIKWPANAERLADDFYKIQPIPCVAGVIDGCHIPVHPPAEDKHPLLIVNKATASTAWLFQVPVLGKKYSQLLVHYSSSSIQEYCICTCTSTGDLLKFSMEIFIVLTPKKLY